MTKQQNPGSLQKRAFLKLSSNIAAIPLFFILESIFPRILGPVLYGAYNYCCTLFSQVCALLELGSNVWFNTKLAKEQDNFSLVLFYLYFIALILVVLGLFAIILAYTFWGTVLLPQVPVWLILPSLLWTIIMWLSRVLRTANDAVGRTSSAEIKRIIVYISFACILLLIFLSDALNTVGLFVVQTAALSILTLSFIYNLRDQWPNRKWSISKALRKEYIAETKNYCLPLAFLLICSTLTISGERWLLQFFYGGSEQGYFSLAIKAGAGCFLFISAFTSLLARDFAVAQGKQDKQAMRELLENQAPLIYSLSSFFSCFIAVEAKHFILLMGGENYLPALVSVQLVAFGTMHQGYMSIASSVFHATGQTRALQAPVLISLVVGSILAWIFIAPRQYYGLELGATGLSLKLLLVQFFTTNALFYLVKKDVPFDFRKNVLHQIICPLSFLVLALITHELMSVLLPLTLHPFLVFFLRGSVYTLLCALCIYSLPSIIGTNKTKIHALLLVIKNRLIKKTIAK